MTTAVVEHSSLVAKMATRFGVDPGKMMVTLKATAFRSDKEISNEQMMALLVVADQYHLNPFTRELYAFADKGGIVPVVSVDGWARIANEHPQFDGVSFSYGSDNEWCEAIVYRKDRTHPIVVREYMAECKRGNMIPWQTHPTRMLRHKAMIQGYRVAFGFAGIYDPEEAKDIIDAEVVVTTSGTDAAKERIKAQKAVKEKLEPPVTPMPTELPTYAEIMDTLKRAQTATDFELVHDLARSLPEDQRKEVEREVNYKLTEFAKKAVKSL